MRDLPGPGLKPVSPALAGGLLTTAPPVKSLVVIFLKASNNTTIMVESHLISFCLYLYLHYPSLKTQTQ